MLRIFISIRFGKYLRLSQASKKSDNSSSDEELFENALECLEADCEISFSNPEEFAEALKGRLKYIFVNQNGSYTIGYDDGYVFGGHEIDVDVNVKGMFVCADVR